MQVINARNVEEALRLGIMAINGNAVAVPSRGGDTLEVPWPVATVYDRPRERVLRCPVRDANPFFHLFESLWILSGREDVAWLAQFNARIAEYSDDGVRFHGAYGARLKAQIKPLLKLLKQDPGTRRAVLQIWDWMRDLGTDSKDIPCNDMIMLKVRDGHLSMRVLCRSNDMLWGAYGANAVQFSMLQEYLADKVNLRVGTLTQVSDSFHVYTGGAGGKVWERVRSNFGMPGPVMYPPAEVSRVTPLRAGGNDWDRDLYDFMEDAASPYRVPAAGDYRTTYFQAVVVPMAVAYRIYKEDGARSALQRVKLDHGFDWHLAAREWLERRALAQENRT